MDFVCPTPHGGGSRTFVRVLALAEPASLARNKAVYDQAPIRPNVTSNTHLFNEWNMTGICSPFLFNEKAFLVVS